MATASVTNTFVSGTTAIPTAVNQNYTDLVTFLNNSVLHLDGTKQMTAALNLKAATDPTTADHATRKAYVDAATLLRPRVNQTAATGSTHGGTWTPTTQQAYVAAESFTQVGNGTAFYSRTFPVAFTGVVAVVINATDLEGGTNLSVRVQAYTVGTTGFQFRMTSDSNGIYTAANTLRVDYIAFGW